MTVAELKEYIWSDLYRHKGKTSMGMLVKYLFKNRSFKITFWFRLAQFGTQNRIPVLDKILRFIYRRVSLKYCVDMPVQVKVGKGLLIYHCFGLVIHSDSIIGDNVMLAHQVTLATEKGAAPVIGNQVRIAPGAKIVGGVHIGDNVVIGANCVVVKSVPTDTVTVGIPNRIIPKKFEDFVDRHYWKASTSSAKTEVISV